MTMLTMLLAMGFTLWKMQFLDISFREYLFKMAQGLVHGNTVISHFGGVDRKCTFCKIKKITDLKRDLGRDPTQLEEDLALRDVEDENRLHIFWECPTVRETITYTYRALWGNYIIDKKDFLKVLSNGTGGWV
jgi:hypothetical protein